MRTKLLVNRSARSNLSAIRDFDDELVCGPPDVGKDFLKGHTLMADRAALWL